MFLPRLFTGLAVVSLASALRVTPGSPCASKCGNTLDATAPSDMACSKADYTGVAGIVLDACLTCQRTSGYVSGNQSDLHWYLYNMRFNLGFCVWGDGNPKEFSNQCVTSTSCLPLYDAISWQNYTTSGGTYDFCSAWVNDELFVPKCYSCLHAMEGERHWDYLGVSNFLTVLDAACIQKPKPGDTLSFDGDPFSTTPVVITTPSPTYASVPMEDYGPVSLGARVGIAFGGIAFILSIVGFCIVWNGKRRRRAFLRDLERRHAEQGWPHPKTRYGGSSGGDMFETPVSQRPLRGWDESPVSAGPDPTLDRPLPRYFSPYSSQYNSPVSATDATTSAAGNQWPTIPNQRLEQIIQGQSPAHGSPPPAFTQWPSPAQEKLMMQMYHERRQTEIAIGLALGGDDASLRSKNSNPNLAQYGSNGYPLDKKGKERDEAYEMVESPYNSNNSGGSSGGGDPTAGRYQMPAEPQAPVLHHPGYGRHHVSRPGTGGTNNSAGRTYLTDEDMRRENLL